MESKIIIFFKGDRGFQVLKKFYKKKNIVCAVLENKKFYNRTKKILDKVIYSKNINNLKFRNLIKKFEPEIFLVAGFSQIFKKEILNISKISINLHAGKVPQYRGGSPLNWQIINNLKYFGLSILKMTKGIDDGPILMQKKFILNKKYTINDLHKISNREFPKMVNKVIKKIKIIKPKQQNEKLSRYWKQRSDKDGKIYFKSYSGKKILRYTKALQDPYPYSWCLDNKNQKIRIQNVSLTKKKIKGPYGLIRIFKDKIYLKCINKNLIINKYKYDNKYNRELKDFEILN